MQVSNVFYRVQFELLNVFLGDEHSRYDDVVENVFDVWFQFLQGILRAGCCRYELYDEVQTFLPDKFGV